MRRSLLYACGMSCVVHRLGQTRPRARPRLQQQALIGKRRGILAADAQRIPTRARYKGRTLVGATAWVSVKVWIAAAEALPVAEVVEVGRHVVGKRASEGERASHTAAGFGQKSALSPRKTSDACLSRATEASNRSCATVSASHGTSSSRFMRMRRGTTLLEGNEAKLSRAGC
eukprot:scaffold63087_cov68-Phaeocystis_antarctica.AAC.5